MWHNTASNVHGRRRWWIYRYSDLCWTALAIRRVLNVRLRDLPGVVAEGRVKCAPWQRSRCPQVLASLQTALQYSILQWPYQPRMYLNVWRHLYRVLVWKCVESKYTTDIISLAISLCISVAMTAIRVRKIRKWNDSFFLDSCAQRDSVPERFVRTILSRGFLRRVFHTCWTADWRHAKLLYRLHVDNAENAFFYDYLIWKEMTTDALRSSQ